MKLFGREGSKEVLGLEEEVNAWLAQHPNIKIVDIRQCASGARRLSRERYME